MVKLVYENSYGNKVEFTYKFPYFLEQYEGIHEKASELYGVSSAFSVGEMYVGRSVNKRNIMIYGYFKDKFIERRQFLYNSFPDDDQGILYFYEDNFSAKIKCRVEKLTVSESGPIRYFTISLIAHNPYFEDIYESNVNLASWEGGIEFPLEIPDEGLEFETKNNVMVAEINNPTKVESGLTIIFDFTGAVSKPSIKNIVTQELLTIDYDFIIGDKVVITTGINDKNIVLTRHGNEININNYLLFGTKFLQLRPGQNNFKILAEEGIENMTTQIQYSLFYEAV